MVFASLSVAVLFAAIFLFGGRAAYRPGQRGRRRFLSFAAGISVAYAIQQRPPVFVCPSDRAGVYNYWYGIAMGTSSYAMCMGSKGASWYNRYGPHEVNYKNNGVFIYYLCRRSADVEKGDGLANTIFLGEARDGNQAILLARKLKPDVVLMDIVMPGLDGVAATRAIRRELPDTEVIALTSVLEDQQVSLNP